MISAYLDASVILSVVLDQKPVLNDWPVFELTVSSVIVQVECSRTLERLRFEQQMDDATYHAARAAVARILRSVELVAVDVGVIARASQPFPTHVATLDAVHLATAALFRDVQPPDEPPLLFATHDAQLARAARALQFDVIGA